MSAAVSNARFQYGATLWGMLSVVTLIVFFTLLLIKLLPAYIENSKVASALEALAEDPYSATMSRVQMVQRVSDTLYIDMAHDLLDLKSVLVIEKTRTHRVVSIDYERVIPLAFNISALLDFENSVEIPLKK